MSNGLKFLKTRWARSLWDRGSFALLQRFRPDFMPGVHIPSITSVAWVYHDKFASLASTRMRGRELCETAQAYLGERYHFDCIDQHTARQRRDSVLFLTKSYLKKARLPDIHRLKQNNNILCADFLDDPERQELSGHIDVFVASSIAQQVHFERKYPRKLTCLVNHHVDPAIQGIRAQQERFAVGYFGDAANARHRHNLEDQVDFHVLDNRARQQDWLTRLPDYSMHYAVRPGERVKRFKPFLKGFTAAACGANILVSVQENDAIHYLGRDYPYLVADSDLDSVRAMLEQAREDFGGPQWHRGLQVMEDLKADFAPHRIAEQIDHLLRNL